MESDDFNLEKSDPSSSKLQNSDILQNLDQKLSHLDSDKRLELKQLVLEYEHLFPDIPSRTDKIYHDVDIIEGSKPVKQHPYRMNPVKQQYLREEVQYLLDNDFIEPSQSEWSSPCILVPKPDGTFRMCTDSIVCAHSKCPVWLWYKNTRRTPFTLAGFNEIIVKQILNFFPEILLFYRVHSE